jgi:hypothetical protein
MRLSSRIWRWGLPGVLTLALLAGCRSAPTMVSKMPPLKYEKLGRATGEACGVHGILVPMIYAIPIELNSRTDRAYQNALASVPGATGLLNVEYKEEWIWWVVVTERCVTISGDAIREVS